MPVIYESEVYPRARLEKMRKASVCAECKGPLALFYDLTGHRAYLACKDYLRTGHTGIEREYKWRQK